MQDNEKTAKDCRMYLFKFYVEVQSQKLFSPSVNHVWYRKETLTGPFFFPLCAQLQPGVGRYYHGPSYKLFIESTSKIRRFFWTKSWRFDVDSTYQRKIDVLFLTGCTEHR